MMTGDITVTIAGRVGSGKTLAAKAIVQALNMVGFRVTKHNQSGRTTTPPLVGGMQDQSADVIDGDIR